MTSEDVAGLIAEECGAKHHTAGDARGAATTAAPRHYYRTTICTPAVWRLKCACGVVQIIETERDEAGGIMGRRITYRASGQSRRVLRKPPPCTRYRSRIPIAGPRGVLP